MAKMYTSTKKTVYESNIPYLMFIACCLFFLIISLFMRSAYNELREEYIEQLRREKEIIDTNKALKMELSAITNAHYLEFKARERLGMKKPKEEEVLVLR